MARENAIWATGAMSGTSLDGVDWADLLTDGEEIFAFGASGYLPYSLTEQAALRAALGAWPADNSNSIGPALEVVMASHETALHGSQGEVIGFHGQTLNHDPSTQRTFQLGDGDALAKALSRTVVWDFRSADVAAGGQGAPLAPVYHHALARWATLSGPVAFLNLGGVGNITWIADPTKPPEVEGNLIAFDTGPANAPINDLMMHHFNKPYDVGGAVAQSGRADDAFIDAFLKHLYFAQPAPKSLDRDSFDEHFIALHDFNPADGIATATKLVAASVAQGVKLLPEAPTQMFVCGGGRHNPVVMASLAAALPTDVKPVESLGIDGDMLEAQAFAYLAVRTYRGMPLSFPMTTAVTAPLKGGRISQP